MSHQKMLVAVCVVAGFVALVAGQNMDPNACAQNVQSEMNAYTKKMQTMINEFSSKMAQSGSSAFDVQGFQKDTQALMDKYVQLTDVSGGMDPQRVMKIGSEIMASQFNLMRKYLMNTDLNMSVVSSAIEMSSSMMRANAELAMKLAQACAPRAY